MLEVEKKSWFSKQKVDLYLNDPSSQKPDFVCGSGKMEKKIKIFLKQRFLS